MATDFKWYYIIASKGIQDFILRGDKLRHMVGGSELIEEISLKLIPEALDKLAISKSNYKILSSAAGGARILFREKGDAEKVAQFLPLAISLHAPGLEAVQALVELKSDLASAMEEAERNIQSRRNLISPVYPPASPLSVRVGRTGLPASGEIKGEAADAAMLAKENANKRAGGALLEKLGITGIVCPDQIEEIAAGNSYVAIMHADANGLGQAVMSLLKELKGRTDAADKYAEFSRKVEACAKAALADALSRLKKPFRPLICAGDDVTVILSAEEALGAAQRFLETFEKTSSEQLGTKLTAAAGVAFIHTSFPFAQGYELCESLCKFAKNKTERKASAVAFWRLTSSLAGEIESIITRELVCGSTVLTMMPYSVGSMSCQSPKLEHLLTLVDALKELPASRMRGLLSEMSVGKANADADFLRIKDVLGAKEETKKDLGKFEAALRTITGAGLWSNGHATPLHDAIEVSVLSGK